MMNTCHKKPILFIDPVLGVHQNRSQDDKEAKLLIEQLLEEVPGNITLEVVVQENEKSQTPLLQTKSGTWWGLDDIKGIISQERAIHT